MATVQRLALEPWPGPLAPGDREAAIFLNGDTNSINVWHGVPQLPRLLAWTQISDANWGDDICRRLRCFENNSSYESDSGGHEDGEKFVCLTQIAQLWSARVFEHLTEMADKDLQWCSLAELIFFQGLCSPQWSHKSDHAGRKTRKFVLCKISPNWQIKKHEHTIKCLDVLLAPRYLHSAEVYHDVGEGRASDWRWVDAKIDFGYVNY